MPVVWWGLIGLFAAVLVNRAADCWLAPVRLQCGLTRHPQRQRAVLLGLPALLVALAWRQGGRPDMAAVACFAAVLALLVVIDFEQRRVPNVVVLPALGLALLWAWRSGAFASAAAGMALAFLAFLGLYALGRRLYGPGTLGMGDVKLAALIGAMVGLQWAPYALLAGILLAGGAAAALLLTGRTRRDDALPYGAFMALAAAAFLLIVR